MTTSEGKAGQYKSGSLTLVGSVAMGTGVMIGAGIFALTGQVAEQVGSLFPWAFVAAAIVAGASAYSYVKMAEHYPSAGGIGMFLVKAYGEGTIAAGTALLMYFSMVINESLVARTFGTYTLRLFDTSDLDYLVPWLGVGLLVAAFVVNLLENRFIGSISTVTAALKIAGIIIFAGAALWAADSPAAENNGSNRETAANFLSATALALLAYKGFTTITNSGAEIKNPKQNIGRSIVISLLACLAVYLLVAFAVAGNLSVSQIIDARDYALAEAARPAFGRWGVTLTIALAIVATFSGLIASTFAVSRMLGMLSEMKLVPHRHFGMPGSIQKHTLVYTVVFAIALTVLLDLSRIAALGAIFYIIMDIAIHWGVLAHLRDSVSANRVIPTTAIVLDVVVLGALLWMKASSDPLVLWVAAGGLLFIFIGERWFLQRRQEQSSSPA